MHVTLTIVQDRGPLIWRPRPATQDQRAHLPLFQCPQAIKAKIGESAEKPRAVGCGQAVRSIPKLNKEIKHTRGLFPAECDMAAEFGACVVSNEQRIGG